MNRYWDLSEKERAQLTAQQVESFLVVECMEQGVSRVEQPVLEEVPEVSVEKRTYYRVGYDGRYSGKDYFDALFETPELAQQFISLKPQCKDSDYTISTEHKYAKLCGGLCVESIELALQSAVLNIKPQLERQAAAKKRNDSLMSIYNEAARKVDAAVSGVWDDWRKCRSEFDECSQVVRTLTEYTGLCDGNAQQAMVFLLKAYDEDQVSAARRMFPESFDTVRDEEVVAENA